MGGERKGAETEYKKKKKRRMCNSEDMLSLAFTITFLYFSIIVQTSKKWVLQTASVDYIKTAQRNKNRVTDSMEGPFIKFS